MQWTDEGILLGTRRHGEANAIIEVMTRQHGRHLGLVRGAAGARLRPVLQPGNSIRVDWRARLDDHLGHYTVEGLRLRAASFLSVPHAVYGVTHLAALCRLLPERDTHPEVHDLLEGALEHLDDPAIDIQLRGGLISPQVARRPGLRVAEVGSRSVARGRHTLARSPPAAAGVSPR